MNAEMQQALVKLDELISRNGFVYALIMAQIEDETIIASNLGIRNNNDRLSCKEILFLWSLLVNKEDFWLYPETLDELYDMRCEIDRVMEDLHFSFLSGFIPHLNETQEVKPSEYKPQYTGTAFQEAIFYSGEALYDEEYIYYIKTRYTDDSQWLKENKGYYVGSFCAIVNKIKETVGRKIRRFRLLSLPETFEQRLANKPNDMTEDEFKKILVIGQFFYDQEDEVTLQEYCDRLKDAISFTHEDLVGCDDVDNYLQLFSFEPSKDCNVGCKEPGDYSVLMKYPIIKTPAGNYMQSEIHQLYKSLYDVPRYWLNEQLDEYGKIGNRVGDFSERQTLKVLKGIFGSNCYNDIFIYKGKQRLTDIDVLCIWKDYALCFQIKSKGLTLLSRQGNIAAVEADFKKSFQAAYDQGIKCRDALLNATGYSFVKKENNLRITFPSLREVYIICETSDEYPSLTHQMTALLQRKDSDPAALAVNLFDIDVMGKYLDKPYYFMHYVHNRLMYYGNTRTDTEANCLYAYTHNRLYFQGTDYDAYMFDNSFAKAIDAELLPKYEKHEEIMVDNSIWRDSTFDTLIEEINSNDNAGVSQIVLRLMNFSRNEVKLIGQKIEEHLQKGKVGSTMSFTSGTGDFGFSLAIMKLGKKKEIHDFVKMVSINELKNNKAKNWLTIVHFGGSKSIVGTLAYISGN